MPLGSGGPIVSLYPVLVLRVGFPPVSEYSLRKRRLTQQDTFSVGTGSGQKSDEEDDTIARSVSRL